MTTALFLSLLFCGSFLVTVHAATGKHCDSSVDLRGGLGGSDSCVAKALLSLLAQVVIGSGHARHGRLLPVRRNPVHPSVSG